MKANEDRLAFLLRLNLELANKEAQGRPVTTPGLPATAPEEEQLTSLGRVQRAKKALSAARQGRRA
jgi:hypothetical protein